MNNGNNRKRSSYDIFCYKKCANVKNNTTKNNNKSAKQLQGQMLSFNGKKSVIGRVYNVQCGSNFCFIRNPSCK
mgnify:CR=1 FL=1